MMFAMDLSLLVTGRKTITGIAARLSIPQALIEAAIGYFKAAIGYRFIQARPSTDIRGSMLLI